MIKCFECIKLEKHNKLRWSQVLDGVVVLAGNSYCYEHLKKEVGWDNDTRQGKDDSSLHIGDRLSQPAVCDICGKTKEEHNHQQVLKKKGINKGKLLREYFWCSENKSDFRQYKERGEG